jgi:hypothetical protein
MTNQTDRRVENPSASRGGPMLARNTITMSPQLWKRVGELAGSSAFLLYLADVGSDRLSLTQAAFFLLAATADAAGKPATRRSFIQAHGDTFRGSIRNSYRQLLEPSGSTRRPSGGYPLSQPRRRPRAVPSSDRRGQVGRGWSADRARAVLEKAAAKPN